MFARGEVNDRSVRVPHHVGDGNLVAAGLHIVDALHGKGNSLVFVVFFSGNGEILDRPVGHARTQIESNIDAAKIITGEFSCFRCCKRTAERAVELIAVLERERIVIGRVGDQLVGRYGRAVDIAHVYFCICNAGTVFDLIGERPVVLGRIGVTFPRDNHTAVILRFGRQCFELGDGRRDGGGDVLEHGGRRDRNVIGVTGSQTVKSDSRGGDILSLAVIVWTRDCDSPALRSVTLDGPGQNGRRT